MSNPTYAPEPLSPEGLLLVMSAIDARKWGRSKAAAVAFIGAHGGEWVELSVRALERWIGIRNRGWGLQVMGSLVDGRVLERLDGAGGRAHAYRVQPDLMAWAGVPWIIDPELIGHRIAAFHGEQHRDADSAESAFLARSRTAPRADFLARSYTARGSRFVARSRTAPEHGAPPGSWRGLGPRDAEAPVARFRPRQNDGAPRRGSSSSSGDADGLVLHGSGSAEEQRDLTRDEVAVERAVKRHAGARFLAPSLRAKLTTLFDRYGHQAVAETLQRIPSGGGPSVLLGELAVELVAPPEPAPGPAAPPPRPLPLVDEPEPDWNGGREAIGSIRRSLDPLGTSACENPHNAGGPA